MNFLFEFWFGFLKICWSLFWVSFCVGGEVIRLIGGKGATFVFFRPFLDLWNFPAEGIMDAL